MTVTRLIEQLSELPPEALVVMSRDAEGNGFSPLSEVLFEASERYLASSTWSGEFVNSGKIDFERAVEAIVLWPVN